MKNTGAFEHFYYLKVRSYLLLNLNLVLIQVKNVIVRLISETDCPDQES